MGVLYAFLMAFESTAAPVGVLNMEEHLVSALGEGGFQIMGFLFFVMMGITLYRIAVSKK